MLNILTNYLIALLTASLAAMRRLKDLKSSFDASRFMAKLYISLPMKRLSYLFKKSYRTTAAIFLIC